MAQFHGKLSNISSLKFYFSRKWQREHKNAVIGSPVFGYMNTQVKTPVVGQPPYQITLEDRMRWAQIADVMAHAQVNQNHYAVEPVPSTRPSSAIFKGYPTLQHMQTGTLSSLNMMQNRGSLPPVPLPR